MAVSWEDQDELSHSVQQTNPVHNNSWKAKL